MILHLATATLLLVSATQAVANIGAITETRGPNQLVRETKTVSVTANLPVEKRDTVRTGNGRVKITFDDKTTVNITEQSRLVIDDFVYSGNPSTSRMALRFASGTARFNTGSGIQKSNIRLNTPAATISVRGTDFATTVDEIGRSLVILLPEEDGTIGELTVSTMVGEVVLNRAFEATFVETADSMPSRPVILNLSLNQIDNMLIVNPPIRTSGEIQDSRTNILDLADLDIDFLTTRELERDYFIDELDKNELDANFLQDYLDEAGDLRDSKDGISIDGTTFGYNESTQIYTIIGISSINISRLVNGNIDIYIPKDESKTIQLQQNGAIYDLKINDGGGSAIIIRQDN